MSLEGTYAALQSLFHILTPQVVFSTTPQPQDPKVYRVLSELTRLCCHSTTISYEGAAIETIQAMSVTVLKELLDKYGDVCDNDDASRRYLEQYAVQVGGGGECEGQIVSAIRRVVQDGCDLRSVEACLKVLILLILKQIVRDEGRFVRSVIMHRNSSETPSLLLARKRSQNNPPPVHCVATQSCVRRVGESDDRPSAGIDHSKLWDCPPRCVRASVEAVACSVH